MNNEDVQQSDTKIKSQFELVEDQLNKHFEFRYNEISNEVECLTKKKEQDEDEPVFKPLNENNLYRWLKHVHLRFSQADLSALLRSDFVPTFNPFKYYFESLLDPPSGIDYIEEFANYVHATDQVRFNYHFKKMLVRSIACAIENNVFNKQAFILVGYEQNSGKSTFCRFLCPKVLDEYYSEGFSLDKDGQISLSENFFINLDELAALSKYEINQLKSSFSKDKIKIRRPFEKKATTAPRRANFLGSTNNAEFLTDETGSVRWLCFEITGINWDYKKDININNVWAQAYSLYKTGFKYNLTLADVTENNIVNRKYQVSTPEAEVIAKKYEPGTVSNHDKFLTPFEISKDINEENSGVYKFTPVNVGKALIYLGFERTQKRINGDVNPTRGYYVLIKSTNRLVTLVTSGTEELPF